MTETLLSIAMIAIFLLMGGSIWMVTKKKDYKRGGLMLVAALVLAANVALIAIPAP